MSLDHYQEYAVRQFLSALPPGAGLIVELGSDLRGMVVKRIAAATSATVIGINPNPEFPQDAGSTDGMERVRLIRGDGRRLDIKDDSVDAVLTIATIEHVIGLEAFYGEVRRILKPGGLFHADFAPVWSCHIGHHTFAQSEGKEARYWKAGGNPVPDFSHLLWSASEMRAYLRAGPCDDRLVEPIVRWIYDDDGINRVMIADHLEALHRSGLLCQRLAFKPGIPPDPGVAQKLHARYGTRHDFGIFGVEASFRKPTGKSGFALRVGAYRAINRVRDGLRTVVQALSPAARRSQRLRALLDRRHVK